MKEKDKEKLAKKLSRNKDWKSGSIEARKKKEEEDKKKPPKKA